MSKPNFDRDISLQCPTCGSTQFEFEPHEGPVHCVGCRRIFQRDELIIENGLVIDFEVDEIKEEVAKYARDTLRSSLKKAFAGSKHIKFK